MNRRLITAVCIIAFSIAVLVFAIFYGPSRRVWIKLPRVELMAGPEEIFKLWETAGIKGRVAVLFTRRLNAVESSPDGSEFKYLETAMKRGMIRAAYHYVPDDNWTQVSDNISRMRGGTRKTSSGFRLLFDAGSVSVAPLSHFHPLREKVLVVIEPGIWSESEKGRIMEMVRSGVVQSDLFIIIRGSASELEVYRRIITTALN